jgi:tRNA-Thr(GGU) m(6)t(6)A37 methyltransferase TsaA
MSPFRDVSDNVPIQGAMSPDTEAVIKVYPEYAQGLRDLGGFSHIILIYAFHKCHGSRLTVRPYMDTETRGVFATRSPHRPNHIGITTVKLVSIDGNSLRVKGIDMVDGTPLLDIKPYVPRFDSVPDATAGWAEKYTSGGETPVSTSTKSGDEWRHA